jgi:hypothetical protein
MTDREKGAFEKIGETVGGIAGQAAGRATDAAADVAGAIFGTAFEALGEWWRSPSAVEAGRTFDERHDRGAREHFEQAPGTGAQSYETARPLYRFGHVAAHHPGYQGRSFREVEPELERAWGEDQRQRFGDWPQVRPYVSRGFDQRSEVMRETREAGMRAQGGGSADEHEIRVTSTELP